MSSPNHPTSEIEDTFSSNFPDYISDSPDYVPASTGKTYSSSSNNSFGIVPIVSQLFHELLSLRNKAITNHSPLLLPYLKNLRWEKALIVCSSFGAQDATMADTDNTTDQEKSCSEKGLATRVKSWQLSTSKGQKARLDSPLVERTDIVFSVAAYRRLQGEFVTETFDRNIGPGTESPEDEDGFTLTAKGMISKICEKIPERQPCVPLMDARL
ncbi:hypothetical protein Tco_0710602 [Tanacetum coccineum]